MRPLSLREWIFIIVIISILEFTISYAAFVNSHNSGALNFISFASTLISIILAVLAIALTYGESIREKTKRDTVAEQIITLSEVIRNIKFESKNLDKITTISDQLTNLAEIFDLRMSKTAEDVSNIKQLFEQVALPNPSQSSTTTTTTTAASSVESEKTVINWLADNTSPAIINSLMMLYYISTEKILGSSFEDLMPFIIESVKQFTSDNPTQIINSTNMQSLYSGVLGTLRQILKYNNLIDLKDGVLVVDEKIADLIPKYVSIKIPKTNWNSYLHDLIVAKIPDNSATSK